MAGFMNPCGLFVALNDAVLVAVSVGLAAGGPLGGLPLVATGFVAWPWR